MNGIVRRGENILLLCEARFILSVHPENLAKTSFRQAVRPRGGITNNVRLGGATSRPLLYAVREIVESRTPPQMASGRTSQPGGLESDTSVFSAAAPEESCPSTSFWPRIQDVAQREGLPQRNLSKKSASAGNRTPQVDPQGKVQKAASLAGLKPLSEMTREGLGGTSWASPPSRPKGGETAWGSQSIRELTFVAQPVRGTAALLVSFCLLHPSFGAAAWNAHATPEIRR